MFDHWQREHNQVFPRLSRLILLFRVLTEISEFDILTRGCVRYLSVSVFPAADSYQ